MSRTKRGGAEGASASSSLAALRFGRRGRFLVPLAERRAVGWFFGHLFVPHGRRERLLGHAADRAARLPGGCERFAFSRPAAAAEALDAAGWLLDGSGRALLADAGIAGVPSPLIVTDYAGGSRRRTLVFLFPAGGGRPVAVAKLRPATAAGEPLAAEAGALRRLAAELPAALAAALPAVLAHGESDGREGLLLSALPGRSVWAELHARRPSLRRAARRLDAAVDWLLAFQAATRSDDAYVPPGWPEPAAGEPEPPWLRRLADRLARRPLPLAAGHGDFWPRNVLFDGDAPSAVVDWEAAVPAAPPFADLFSFAWSHGLAVARRRGGPRLPAERAFRHAFLDHGPLSRSLAPALRRHGAACGLDPDTLRDLFRLWLLQRAAGDPEGGPTWRTCERMLGRAGRSAFSG